MREVSEFEFPPLQSNFRCKWATDKQEHFYQGQHPDMVILLQMITLHRHQLLDIQYLVTIHIPLVRPHFKSHYRGAWKILD